MYFVLKMNSNSSRCRILLSVEHDYSVVNYLEIDFDMYICTDTDFHDIVRVGF